MSGPRRYFGKPLRAALLEAAGAAALFVAPVLANPPAGKYIFPAGGQRGTTVHTRVGGCFFHGKAGFEIRGEAGVDAPPFIIETDTTWFQGPLIPQPASQAAEDYPRDHSCTLSISQTAPLGPRAWRAWTSQGATPIAPPPNDQKTVPAMRFIVGDLPEVIENEVDGAPIPVPVNLPVTINGRIFPRENVDAWSFHAAAGQQITCDVVAKRLGSPLDAELQIFDPGGRPMAGRIVHAEGDPCLHFIAAQDGDYQVRIHDVAYGGLQNYVYRLTITAGRWVDSVYPLGGRRGSTTRFDLTGSALPATSLEAQLPTSGGVDRCTIQFDEAGKRTNAVQLDLDDLPEIFETEPNDRAADAKTVQAPCILNGRIDHPGDLDYWAFEAKKDQSFDLDVHARRLGSPLDSVLTIYDAAAKQLARNDDMTGGQPDSQLSFKAPADGIYYIRIEDRFASRGGPSFAYRVRITPSLPDYRLTFASDALTLVRSADHPELVAEAAAAGVGGESKGAEKKAPPPPQPSVILKVDAERLGGFNSAIALDIDGLPPGVVVEGATIVAGQASANIKFTAAPHTKIGIAHLQIRGREVVPVKTAGNGNPAIKGIAPTAQKSPGDGKTNPDQNAIAGGTAAGAGRNSQAAVGSEASEKKSTVEQSPPHIAKLAPAPNQPRVDDVLLAIALPTPFKTSGMFQMPFVTCGSVFRRHYLLDRTGYDGPLTVRVADRQARHLQGVTGPIMTISAGVDAFDYAVTFASDMELGRTSRTCIMLTGTVKDFDGSEHVVSYSSVDPTDQFAAITTASLLNIRLEKPSMLAHPGQTEPLPIEIQRSRELQGQPVKVELILPAPIHDVQADPITLLADQSSSTLYIHFGPHPGSFTLPAILRATAQGPQDPTHTDANIDLVPEPNDAARK